MRIQRSSPQRDAQQVRARLQSLLRGGWVPDPEPPPDSEPAARVRWDPGRRGAVVLVALAVLAAALTGLWLWHSRPVAQAVTAPPPAPPSVPATMSALPSAAPSQITVAVAGKVRHPGVVRLPAGSRVVDAVSAAGGVARGAHLGLLNLAKVLADGEQVVVGMPAAGAPGAGPVGSAAPTGPVNLNTATLEQLDSLPGVGPSTAQKILDWRTSNGPFQSVDQLQDVSGIGPAKFAALQAEVTV